MDKCKVCENPVKRDASVERLLRLEESPEKQLVFRCGSCGSRFMYPPLSKEILEKLYEGSYFEDQGRDYSYRNQVEEESRCYETVAKSFANYLGDKGCILDVGCATGEFMLFSKRLGFKVIGIDVSEYAVEKAREKGLDVHVATIDEAVSWQTKFDGINMGHVLEHLEDPVSAMKGVSRSLRKGGVLYVEVPNQFNSILDLASFLNFRQPPEFGVFSVHHRVFFSCRAIKILLEKCGFEVLKLTTFRREKRIFGFRRRVILNGVLTVASFFNRGDVISVWAKAT